MALILINKVLNNEISLENLQNWILHDESKITSLRTATFNTSAEDFISYFLNFVHEKTVSEEKNSEDTPLKCSTPKQKETKLPDEDTKSWPQLLPEPQNVLNSPKQFIKTTPTDLKKTPNKYTESPHRLEEISGHILNISNPVSPLHSYSNGFATPKVKRPLQSPKSCDKISNLCFGDFLIKPKTSNKKRFQKKLGDTEFSDDNKDKNVRARRINPTCLSKKISENEQTDNCFNFKSNSAEVEVENITEQRNILLEERMKIISRTNSNERFRKLPVKKIQSAQSGEKPEIVAEMDNVTFKKQLDKIVSIYSFLLQHNYVLNITAELCFLITLFIQKQQEYSENSPIIENFDKPEIIFCNPHNRVYFSAKVLEKNTYLFYILDRPSLKLLLDNKNLKNFSQITHKQIEKIYESKNEKSTDVLKADADLNVCFISDTDSRENFSSNLSFHAFRKQRDVFYEILRIWETNHLLPNWNFGVALGSKIKYIFNINSDPTNFMHFSRLFKAQLLKNCVKNGKVEDDSNENEFSTLSSLSGMTSEKFSLLKSRITTKQFSNGINTAPIFTDYQEFYKEFLIVASNYIFYSHLKDQLISDIIELNDFKFDDYELVDDKKETYSNSSVKKSFIVCLKSLRVLAKFLGFLQSLPYKNDPCGGNVPPKVLKYQTEIRSQIRPSLNLKSILESSIRNKTLVITIPWVTKYISMLDYVELRVPRFLEVYEILFYIHKSFTFDETVLRKFLISNNVNFNYLYSVILIKLCLGWLFDLPHFPEGFYYEWCFKNDTGQDSNFLKISGDFFDGLNIVDQNILRICCPYLDEIKKILSSSSNVSNSSSRIKHITPVTTVSSSSELMKKKIQYQLEEAFFSGQPASVRKTVEFVSERVASACVKQICYEIVPDFKRKTQEDLKEILLTYISNGNVPERELNAIFRAKINEFSVKKFNELENFIQNNVDKQISDRVPVCVDLLLSFDALPQTKKVCGVISSRICSEKVSEWIKTHITASTFSKDYESVVKGIKSNIEKSSRLEFLPCESHSDNALGPATLLDYMRGFIWDLMENPQTVTPGAIRDLFGTISSTFCQRDDVSRFSFHAINQMTVDLVLNLVTYVPKLTDKNFLTEVVLPFFKKIDNSDDLFETVICPRNVMLLAQSPEGQRSWECLAVFLSLILKDHLMSLEQFETQVVALYKNSWDEMTLKTLSRFYRDVIDTCREMECTEDKFAFLVTFLSEFCSDL